MTKLDLQWVVQIEKKLDRILNDVAFIKNRTATYLGRNEVLTYLIDETPIFVNSDDYGCPINFINGGLYEEDNIAVFRSFRNPNLPMLDVGANLGVFSLRMAPELRNTKIHAFEPIPRINSLFSRSSFLNGYSELISIHRCAVSNSDGTANLNVPAEHAGGASITATTSQEGGITVDVKRLDSKLGSDFKCGLVKLDVEGHELNALKGMRQILERSPECMVMFEKLSAFSGIEDEVFEFFSHLGFSIFSIIGRTLKLVDVNEFKSGGGYFVAAMDPVVKRDGMHRDFIVLYPVDLNVLVGQVVEGEWRVDVGGCANRAVLHGPYWYLSRGYYRFEFEGLLSSKLLVEVCEQFGYKVGEFELLPDSLVFEMPIHRDLSKFEIVFRPLDNIRFVANLKRFKITKIG